MGLLRRRRDQAHDPRVRLSAATALRGQGLVAPDSLAEAFGELAPWPYDGDLSQEQWARYIDTARAVQRADADDVERAIADFLPQDEHETRLFLLQRVVFDLPEKAPESERRSYKGWVNWPPPAPDGTVSLAWPITWSEDGPSLADTYEGSEGPRYAAVEEYRHLRDGYGFRAL